MVFARCEGLPYSRRTVACPLTLAINMNDKAKLIGWSAIAIAIIGFLTGLRDIGAMLFVGMGNSASIIRVYSITLIILPMACALILFTFGLKALYSKSGARRLALIYVYGQFVIAALQAIFACWSLGDQRLLLKILALLFYPISLPLLYAVALFVLYFKQTPESRQGGPGCPPQGVGPPEP